MLKLGRRKRNEKTVRRRIQEVQQNAKERE